MTTSANQYYSATEPMRLKAGLTGPELGFSDRRWLVASALVLGVLGVGVLAVTAQGLIVLGPSFSARVSMIYVPIAAVIILFLGWSSHGFPIAAAVFFGYLGTAQAAHADYFLLGDIHGALTFEAVLALPLLIVGLAGPAPQRYAAAPPMLNLGFAAVLITAFISTVLAVSPATAIPTFFARFVLPILVTVALARRLRSIDDYFVVWVGFLAGLVAISVFSYRRAVLGVTEWYAFEVSQRFAGVSGSFAIPAVYICGAALWLGHGYALRRSLLAGVALLCAATVFVVLVWIGAHRGPLIFIALLVVWWLLVTVIRTMHNFRVLLLAVLGAAAVAALVVYSLRHTTLDLSFMFERLQEIKNRGVTDEPRWHIWMQGMRHAASSPLWGVGLNNWVYVEDYFESIHSAFFGIIFDMGILGLTAFGLLFAATLLYVRKPDLAHLPYLHQRFFLGCRAGWIVMLLLLATNLPFTSGQPRNNIFTYAVYFYPLLVMVTRMRHPKPALAPVRSVYGVGPDDPVILAGGAPAEAAT